MKINREKLATIGILLRYILFSGDEWFSITKLQVKTGISVSEIRTIVQILYEFQLLYSKDRVGIFINKKFLKKLRLDQMEFNETNDFYEFKSSTYELIINKTPELEAIDLFSCNKNFDYERNLEVFYLIMIYAHYQYNLLYEKNYCCKEGKISFIKTGKIAKNEKIILQSHFTVDNYVVYR